VFRRTLGPLAAFAAFGVFWGAWGLLLPDVKEQVGASVAELGAALLTVGLAALPAMLATGLIADRVGGRAVPPALVLFGAAIVLPGLTDSVWQLALVMAAVGAASGALDVVINVAVTTVEALGRPAHHADRARALLGRLPRGRDRRGPASRRRGWSLFLIGAAVMVFATAWLNRGTPRAPAPPRGGRGLRFPSRVLVLGGLCAVAFVAESGIENWSALFLEDELDAAPAVSGLGPGLFAAAMVTGRTLGQGLEARVGNRPLLTGGALVAAGGLALAAVSPRVPVALVGFALGGAGISVAAPTLFGAAGRGASDAERGSAVASVTTIAYLGFLTGPFIMGSVSGAFGLRAGMVLLAGTAVLVAVGTASFAGDALPLRRLQHPPRGELP
jgi:MFS family permease